MHRVRRLLGSIILASAITGAAHGQDLENMLYMDLASGRVVIELRPDLAPKHVARIKELAREGFYDGIVFHRVIPGFMAQTGDPTGTGRGSSDKPDLPAEFSNEPFVRGTVGMARTSDPNSANSQFFINYAETPHLNGQYTVWGQVVEGMDYLDQIAKGEPPANPDKIIQMRVATDAEQ
jgi:peptidylprolyl isomerase